MVPEIPWSIEEVAERVKWGVVRGKRSMILVFAEGAMRSQTADLQKLCSGNPKLNDIIPHNNNITSSQVAHIIEILSGHETRSTVLGYIQRGGSPSARDRMLATQLGAHAVEMCAQDRGGVAVGIRGTKLIEVPFSEVQIGEHAADTGLSGLVDTMAVINR
jgi:6-phosphofructokinase 1